MLPIAAGQARAAGGAPWQEMVVQLCHIPAAIGLIAGVAMLIAGFLSQHDPVQAT